MTEDDTGGFDVVMKTRGDSEPEEVEVDEGEEEEDEIEEEEDEEEEDEEEEEEDESEEEEGDEGGEDEEEEDEEEEEESGEDEEESGEDEEEEKVAEEEEEEAVDTGKMTLKQRTKEIRKLDKQTGGNAWNIGSHLQLIVKQKLYKANFETFDTYCEQELGYTRVSASNFIKIHKTFKEGEAKKLSIFKLLMLTNKQIPDGERKKLFKEAVDGIDNKTLKQKAKAIVDEVREQKGLDPQKPQRKPKSTFQKFVGTSVRGGLNKEKTESLIELDDTVGIQVKILKRSVKIEFVNLVSDE